MGTSGTGRRARLVRAPHGAGSFATVSARIRPDIIIEATGVSCLIFDAMARTGSYGIVRLTGVSPAGRKVTVDAGAINRDLVLENDAVIGSVNPNLRHYAAAVEALTSADRDWLSRLVTRRVPLERAREAFESGPDDIKTVVMLDP